MITEKSLVRSEIEVAGDEFDSLGVINALERTCELESKLRQAIQQTHPLTTTLEWDFAAADREREALLAISEQLEYLEDKLREYRFLNQTNSEQKAVLLSQLDSVRKELLDVLSINSPRVVFAKEIVKEVLNFASAGDDTPRSGLSPTQLSSRQNTSGDKNERGRNTKGGNTVSNANKNSNNYQRIPAENSLFSLMNGSITSTPSSKSNGHPSYSSLHDNQLWVEDASCRHSGEFAIPVPGASTLLNNPTNKSNNSGRRYSSTTSGNNNITQQQITDEDIYGPAVPRGSAPTSEKSVKNFGGMIKVRELLSRAEKELSAVTETKKEQRRATPPPRIVGPHNGRQTPESIDEAWDGYITPPLTGDIADDVTSETPTLSRWHSISSMTPTPLHRQLSSVEGGTSITDQWQIHGDGEDCHSRGFGIRNYPSSPTSRSTHNTTSTPSNKSGLNGLVGKLAGLAFVLGSIAAAAMVATTKSQERGDDENDTYVGRGQSKKSSLPSSSSSSSSLSSQRKTSTTKRKAPVPGGADSPPWVTSSERSADRHHLRRPAMTSDTNNNNNNSNSSARRKAAPGKSALSTPKSSAPRNRGVCSGQTSGQSPVMHVQHPPSSGSFPSNPPPDVTAAMG